MKKIATISTKGGVGKTLLSMYLAVKASQEGKKICLIDFDTYGPTHLSLLDYSACFEDSGMYISRDLDSFMSCDWSLKDKGLIDDWLLLAKIRGVSEMKPFFSIPLHPSTFALNRLNANLSSYAGWEYLKNRFGYLWEYLKESNFEYCIMDLPPGLYLGPAQLFGELVNDSDVSILYLTTMSDADMLASIYDMDWIFSDASPFKITGQFRWIVNKMSKNTFDEITEDCYPAEAALFSIKKHLYKEISKYESFGSMNTLVRLLSTIPPNTKDMYETSASYNVVENSLAIPYEDNVGQYMAETSDENQRKLWPELLLNEKTPIGQALKKIYEEVL